MRKESVNGVMLNAYPDSIGHTLADTISMLKRSEFEDVFSLFYILPTFFHSDLDRGFSIIDYDLNDDLVSLDDLRQLDELGIKLKFDLVLNHLSVASPQFKDLLEFGDESKFRDFFIDWNDFWRGHGEMGADGYVVPDRECLDMLFMRKPGLPLLKVRFPDGSERPYWNTFYQEVNYGEVDPQDLARIQGLSPEEAKDIAAKVNAAIAAKSDPSGIDLGELSAFKREVASVVAGKRTYLGQMDLNAQSEAVWDFYDETLSKLRGYGAVLIRLDAFAYLHKRPCMSNFFNKPGTWYYLDKLRSISDVYGLSLLPEIHPQYGQGLHAEVSGKGFTIYDFFFPGLLIDALDRATSKHLLQWIDELIDKDIRTVNMLGSHDGIPVLDLGGIDNSGAPKPGLLSNEQIDRVVENILRRGGRVKNLYDADGKKISYYQVNATFFSALGEDEQKLRLARAIQMFMPGIPQVWYLDLFAGKNDYAAADRGGTAGHKEINRTSLTDADVRRGLERSVVQDQLKLMKLRNTSPAFDGQLDTAGTNEHVLCLTWRNGVCTAALQADLRDCSFSITHRDDAGVESAMSFDGAGTRQRGFGAPRTSASLSPVNMDATIVAASNDAEEDAR